MIIRRQSLISTFTILLVTGVVYLFNTKNSHIQSNEYQDIALAEHEMFASENYFLKQKAFELSKGKKAFERDNFAISSNSRSQNLFAPAINAVAIGKFLNGNLPATTPNGNTGVPTLLSQTGAFSNPVSLTPSPGLIPYDMVEPFWSDGATKKRWMVIPNDGSHNTPEEQIQYSQDNAWDFPQGTVLIKHFEFPGKRLETRFEVKGDDDVYYYLTYKWNASQTDATLLNNALDEDIVVNGATQSWHYPSSNECASCHFPQNGSVLGPKTRNLNKSILYPTSGITMNQLVNLSELGIITENITTGNVSSYPTVAAKDDLSASLEDRARTYLDVNCASCHNPQVDNIALFDARYSTPIENQNIINGNVIYDEGLNNPKVIIPQDVSNSMAHFRMNSTQTGIEMPPLAKDVVDTEGVQLIADWINSLTPTTANAPVAAFSASTTYGPAPLAVNFDATASYDFDGDNLTYSWNFGDTNTAQGQVVNHTYNTPGSYSATLTVNDGQQTDQETTAIIVNNGNPGSNTVAFSDGTNLVAQDNFSGLPMGVIDMNGDGKDDIVQFNSAKNLRIQYQNGSGQTFTSYNHGQVSSNNQWGTVIADFDQNGYNDIMSGGAYDNLKIIKNNNGNNSYSQSILGSSNIFLQGSNFVDINNDGWADIFACHDDAESRAFENNQDGTLTYNANLIRTFTTPSSDNSGNYASMWIDYDNDRDLDLYISKCRGGVTSISDPRRINMLWQNDGNNNFTEVADQANLKIGDQTWLSDFGDIDNDGDLDAIVINHGTGPNLMRNNGNGTFTEITSGSGLMPTLEPQDFYGIQGFFRDFNNDGHLDLMVSGDNHYLFYNNGDGTFQNAANPFNSNQIQSFSVGDINHDGFLDIYAGYANGLNSPSSTRDRIWLNEGNSNNFLNIQLEGVESNINGIGARVEIYGTWGIQIRDVRSGEGYGLVNSFTQHFGIGVNEQVDKVIVRWPSGIVDEILNPEPNQFLEIIEGAPISVTGVSISPETTTLTEGLTQQLTATLDPANADDTSVNWSSSDLSVAAVDSNGLLTAVAEGSATITVTTTDGGFTDTTLIEVIPENTNTCTASGTILMERYDGISGSAISNLLGATNYPDNPSVSSQLTLFEIQRNQGDNYGTRVSGYLCPPETGTYYFYIAGNNHTELNFSTTDDPVDRVRIAHHESYASNRQWDKFPTQKSQGIVLQQGSRYYIEALMKEASAGDNLAVGWRRPSDGNGTLATEVIPGNVLSPVVRDNISVTGVAVSPTELSISEGAAATVSATVSPSNASDRTVVWSTSNPAIATVDSNGFVTGVLQGNATITATTNDGGFIDTMSIEVTTGNQNNCTASGTILMERYDGISGSSISDLLGASDYPDSPSLSTELALLEIPRNQSDNYGTRVSGYLCPPETGTYYFFIAGNNHTELNLSTTDDPVDRVKIAHHESYAGNRQWDKFATQKSQGILLQQGNRYYVEALMKEASAGDNLAVGWRRPGDGDGSLATEVIPGSVLSPVVRQTVPVTGVASSPNMTIAEGGTTTLTATVSPSNATDRTVTWVSSDTSIATVGTDGLVTAITEGSITITVTTNDGGFSDTTIIDVIPDNPSSCTASGSILMERYDGIGGSSISDLLNALNYPDSPSINTELNLFEIQRNQGDNYGTRVRGYLCPPETGTYYFYIAGNNHTELNLSTSEDPADKARIAHHESYASNRQWDKFATQKSQGILLQQGNRYYIEALMKEDAFGDNLAVGWRRPSDGDGTLAAEVIPGSVLSPSINGASSLRAYIEPSSSLTLSPVPTSNTLNLEYFFNNPSENSVGLYIYDNIGRAMIIHTLSHNSVDVQIDVSHLSSGVYLLRLTKDEETLVKRFTISD